MITKEELLDILPKKELYVIKNYFGVDETRKSLKQIGLTRLNCKTGRPYSVETMRQRKDQGLRRMRRYILKITGKYVFDDVEIFNILEIDLKG